MENEQVSEIIGSIGLIHPDNDLFTCSALLMRLGKRREPIFCSVGENGFENFLPMLCRLRLAPIISNVLLYSLVFIILVPQHLGPYMMSYIPKKLN